MSEKKHVECTHVTGKVRCPMCRYTKTGRLIRNFHGTDVVLAFSSYLPRRERVALQLITLQTDGALGEPFAVCTVNLPDDKLDSDEVAIKNWSENEQILDWLVDQGVVEVPHRTVRSGHIDVPICHLLIHRNEVVPV
jgi:hypothetical protein